MFYDLDVPMPTNDGYSLSNTKGTLSRLRELGYGTVALSLSVEGKLPPKVEVPAFAFPVPCDDMRQLSRITLKLEEEAQVFALTGSHEAVRDFDIVAVQPCTEKMFNRCCQNLQVDIITIDLGCRSFAIKNKPTNVAIGRGIQFEISYRAGLGDHVSKTNFIKNAQSLWKITRGRNVIFSSSARSALEVRDPYELMAMGRIFAMDAADAKKACSFFCRAAILHAKMRRDTNQGVVSFEPEGSMELPELSSVETALEAHNRAVAANTVQLDEELSLNFAS